MQFEVNTTGIVSVTPPYKIQNKLYTLSGINQLSVLLSRGVDVYGLVYKPTGLLPDEFSVLVKENPTILTLTDSSKDTVYIPASAVRSIGSENTTSYATQGIILGIGEHPLDREYTTLIEQLKDTVLSHLGVVPDVRQVAIGAPVALASSRAKEIEEQRTQKALANPNPTQKIKALEDQITLAKAQIRSLVRFTRTYLEACCRDGGVCWGYEESDRVVHYEKSLDIYVRAYNSGGNPANQFANAFSQHLLGYQEPYII